MTPRRSSARPEEDAAPVEAPWIRFVCPACRGELVTSSRAYSCPACIREYPVVEGIPDFRVRPDPWLSFEEDLDRTLQLKERVEGKSLEETVRTYWRIAPDTPLDLAESFIAHVMRAGQRSREWLDRVAQPAESATDGDAPPWIDLGCGTGDLSVAASERGARVVATDIALRWLFVSGNRPGMDSDRIVRVCCCAEALPFRDATFGRALSLGLLEHCQSEHAVLGEAARVLVPGGGLDLRTVNRFSMTREPHVRLWGVGFLPRRLADPYVRRRTKRPYDKHRPLSLRELREGLRRAGLERISVHAAPLLKADRAALTRRLRRVAPLYHLATRLPGLGKVVSWVSPLLEATGRRPA